MRVLVIEDDVATAVAIERMLVGQGVLVECVSSGNDGIVRARLNTHDVIVLGLILPDMSGYDVLRILRGSKLPTPIMILSSLASIEDKVLGLTLGADDYMTKPFHQDELIARVYVITRRARGMFRSVIVTGNIAIDLHRCFVTVGGAVVGLNEKEYQLFKLLSLHKGYSVSRDSILRHLYRDCAIPNSNVVDVFVCGLRKKISSLNGGQHHIWTVRLRGFILSDEPVSGDESVDQDDSKAVVAI